MIYHSYLVISFICW